MSYPDFMDRVYYYTRREWFFNPSPPDEDVEEYKESLKESIERLRSNE